METAFFIGRIIFGIYWLGAAYSHLVKGGDMIGYAASKGLKSPKLAIYGTGALLLLGAISMLLGIYPTAGIILLIAFLLGVTFKMHDFWREADTMNRMNSRINFEKNLALVGALLMMLAIAQPWPLSLGL